MIVNYPAEMLAVLNKVDTAVRKNGKKHNIKFGITEIHAEKMDATISIETNSCEYIHDLIYDLVKKTKFRITNFKYSSGHYDWDADVYLRPYVMVKISPV